MSEREKFEKWLRDTWNQFNDFSFARPGEGHQYEDMSVQDMWVGWQAALSTRKPFAFGLVDKDGKPWSDCARENEDFLRQEYDHAYPDSAPFCVVELFYEDSES